MNFAEFKLQHRGIKAIVRRHFNYTLPLDATEKGFGKHLAYSLVYSRSLDHGELGLDLGGVEAALHHATQLHEMSIIPSLFLSGEDRRNRDGAFLTADKLAALAGAEIQRATSPALTYPYYSSPERTKAVMDTCGDFHTHMYLAERPELKGFWTETAATFEARILSAVHADYGVNTVFFDLNWEALVLLYYMDYKRVARKDIPFGKSAWCPTKGGGLLYGVDGTVREFRPDFTLVPDFSGIND